MAEEMSGPERCTFIKGAGQRLELSSGIPLSITLLNSVVWKQSF